MSWFVFYCFFLSNLIFSQPSESQDVKIPKQYLAEKFMNMSIDDAFKEISTLSRTESEELILNIRELAKKEYSKIDNFYFLISHLEKVRAIEEEEKKLKGLNVVYTLGLLLFSFFLLFIFIKQRLEISKINRILEENTQGKR